MFFFFMVDVQSYRANLRIRTGDDHLLMAGSGTRWRSWLILTTVFLLLFDLSMVGHLVGIEDGFELNAGISLF